MAEAVSQQISTYLDRLAIPKLNNKRLVICEDDLLFNNRWLEVSGPNNLRIKTVNYDTEVLVRSDQILDKLKHSTNLQFLKVSQISLSQLRKFEGSNLIHLEIGVLLAHQELGLRTASDPVKISRLVTLRIDKFGVGLPKGPNRLVFDLEKLYNVYLGKQYSR